MKKLKFILVTLLFVTLTFVTSVYAWLQISNINTIDNIYLDVRLGDELEISLDGINFTKSIDHEDFKEVIKDLIFKDVTTLDNELFTLGPNLYNKRAKENIDYLSVDLYFKITPEEYIEDERVFKEIYLVNNKHISYEEAVEENVSGTYITSKGKRWVSDYDFNNGNQEVKKGESGMYYAKDAMRIGFNSNEYNFIFDTSEDETRGYGKSYGAFDYFNLKNEMKLNLPKEQPDTLYSLSKEIGHTGIMDSNNSLITKLVKQEDYYIGKTTLNIWLEGWDADAFDAIRQDHLLISLEFQAARHLKNESEEE